MKQSRTIFFSCMVLLLAGLTPAQQVYDHHLLNADKLYIERDYNGAVNEYLRYLEEHPRDYYASRQAAMCYHKVNDEDHAIDHWPAVAESSQITEKDFFEYARSLMANNRVPEAKRIFLFLSKSTNKPIAKLAQGYLIARPPESDTARYSVTEVAGINSAQREFCPFMSKGKLYSVFDPVLNVNGFHAFNKQQTGRVKVAIPKDSVNMFPVVTNEKLAEWPVTGQFCISPDGVWLYFAKPVSAAELRLKGTFFRFQLYALNLTKLNDQYPQVVKFEHNRPEFDQMSPAISPDGKRLFFSCNMTGGYGEMDLYYCDWDGKSWSAPKNAGAEVNSVGNEVYPHVSEKGVLYYASDFLPGQGGFDIFIAVPDARKPGNYFQAFNAGGLNSRFDDFGIYTYDNGRKGYLSSKRSEGNEENIFFFRRD